MIGLQSILKPEREEYIDKTQIISSLADNGAEEESKTESGSQRTHASKSTTNSKLSRGENQGTKPYEIPSTTEYTQELRKALLSLKKEKITRA